MYDATFFVDEDFCLDFINWQIEQKRFKSWICDGRAMDIERFSDKTLELAVKSGLKCVVVGLESGSEKIAKLHNKEHDHVNRYRRAITRLKDYDVDIRSGVIFGTPTETVDDLKASLDFIVEMTTVNPRLSCSTTTLGALPATELYNLIRKERGEIFPQTLEGWAEESDKTHYYYNSLNPEFPWIDQNIVPEYKKVYHDFWKDHTHLWR
jgi:radical SAM superfamily enzyme YgiQ (UPF0313 family)